MAEQKRQIFRQQALDKMASPDRVDRPVTLIGPARWLLLVAFAVLVIGGLIWALIISLPVKVKGSGLLLSPAGQARIEAPYGGQLAALEIEPGTVVEADEIVARLSRPDLDRAVREAAARLEDARLSAEEAEAQFTAAEERLQKVLDQRLAAIKARRGDLRQQLKSREDIAESYAALVPDAASQLEYNRAVEQVDAVRAEIRDLDQLQFEIEASTEERLARRARERFEEEKEIRELTRTHELLTTRAETETKVRATSAGRVTDVLVNPGDVVTAGQAIARTGRSSTAGGMEAVIYIPAEEGKRLAPGMAVELVPTITKREVYGYIRGQITSVSPLPVTREGMQRVLQDARLADQLAATGAPIEARVLLEASADTPTGYLWSSSQGPDAPLTEGTLVQADVIIERKSVLSLVLPGLAR